MKRFLPLIPIVMLGCLMYLSSEFLTVPPDVAAHSMYIQMDAVAHVFMYFFLGLLVTRYVSVSLQVNSIGALVIAVALCVTFGVLDEFHQTYVPNRGAEFSDLMWDLVGATAGGLLYVLVVGFGKWIREFLSSAEIGAVKVLCRAVVAVIFLVGIMVPSVVYAGRIADFVRTVVVEGSYYAVSVIDSYVKTYNAVRTAGLPLRAKAQSPSELASLMPLVQGTPALAATPAVRTLKQPEKEIELSVPQPDTVGINTEPSGDIREKSLEQIGSELLGELFAASSGGVAAGQIRANVATAVAALKEQPGYAEAIGTVSKDPRLRKRVVQALGSSTPQVHHAVYTWRGQPQPGMGSHALGVGNGKPDPCDLVAVIAHRSVPVDELTVDQVRKIFSGEFLNWSDVGGPDQPIKVVTVRKQSEELEKYLTNHLKSRLSPNAIKLPFISLMIPVVAETKGAVGFLPVQNTEQLDWLVGHEAFKRIAIKADNTSPAVVPSRMSFNTGQYPFMKNVAPVPDVNPKTHRYALADQDRKGR